MNTITLHKESGFTLTIAMPNTTNLWFAAESAKLHCSCQDFAAREVCQHTRFGETKFKQWKVVQMRRLRRDLVGNTPLDVLTNPIAEEYGLDVFADTLIIHPGSAAEVFVQKETPVSKRYAFGCGFGTCGREVIKIDTWPATGVLSLLINSNDGLVNAWQYEINKELTLGARELPPLSPRVLVGSYAHQTGRSFEANPFSGIGHGLLDISGKNENEDSPSTKGDEKARWQVQLAGLSLCDSGYIGDDLYFPRKTRYGDPIGALAVDFETSKLKTIPQHELGRYTENIPTAFQSYVAHVHLPWGQVAEDSVYGQVLVCHPQHHSMQEDDDLQLLTTNFWEGNELSHQSGYESLSEELNSLAIYTAEMMVRLGHDPQARLIYGGYSDTLEHLSGYARSQTADPILVQGLGLLAHSYLTGTPFDPDLVTSLQKSEFAHLVERLV